jgi:hypothetical protein
MPNNVSHNSDDSSNGHNNALVGNLCTLGRNGHDDHPNVFSLGHGNCKGTKCDVDVKGDFVARG